MEIRFFAPGNLVSNLDFVESIFGNGGNPTLAEFDAALDVEHWSGHTGCVILAPHLVRRFVQATHGYGLVASAAMGGVLLMGADVLSRWLIAPQELPVGVLTAVLGGSYLLWLLQRRRMG